MVRVSNVAIDLIEAGAAQRTPAAVGRAFFGALDRFGVRVIHARTFGVPHTPETERVLSRISPPGWEELYATPCPGPRATGPTRSAGRTSRCTRTRNASCWRRRRRSGSRTGWRCRATGRTATRRW